MSNWYSLAEILDVISLLKAELRHGHGHSDLPTFVLLVECLPELVDEVIEVVFVLETPSSVGGSGVFPVQVKSVETVFVHVF